MLGPRAEVLRQQPQSLIEARPAAVAQRHLSRLVLLGELPADPDPKCHAVVRKPLRSGRQARFQRRHHSGNADFHCRGRSHRRHGACGDLAQRLGVGYWGTRHDSDAFRLEILDYLVGAKNAFLMRKDIVGLPVSDGVDEIAVALASEAYEDTLRARVRVVAEKDRHVRTRGGLTLLADSVAGDGSFIDYSAPAFDNRPAGEPRPAAWRNHTPLRRQSRALRCAGLGVPRRFERKEMTYGARN